MKKIRLPLNDSVIKKLKAGDRVLLNGIVYTARDAAHKRLGLKAKSVGQCPTPRVGWLKAESLPFDIRGQIIYYAGPTPAPPGKIIGSCGPTTSRRMDVYTPVLLRMGLKGMIGKGNRSSEVAKAIRKYRAVYFIAIGGAGALLSKKIKSVRIVAYRDLGPEAIYKLEVENFPVIVGMDSSGKNIYNRLRS